MFACECQFITRVLPVMRRYTPVKSTQLFTRSVKWFSLYFFLKIQFQVVYRIQCIALNITKHSLTCIKSSTLYNHSSFVY